MSEVISGVVAIVSVLVAIGSFLVARRGYLWQRKKDEEEQRRQHPPLENALSDEAKELLLEAVKAKDSILRGSNMTGVYVQIGPKSFCETGNRRSEALWEAALEQLREHGLVGSENNQTFRVTGKGYQVADALMGQK